MDTDQTHIKCESSNDEKILEPVHTSARELSISFTKVADRFLLAGETMAVVRHKHEIENVGLYDMASREDNTEIHKWSNYEANGTAHSAYSSTRLPFNQPRHSSGEPMDKKEGLFSRTMFGMQGNDRLPLNQPKPERPKQRVTRPPLLPPCRVCGDRASGLHYGVNTCEACKGFFRRSINKSVDAYTCIGKGHCKLVPGKRTACSSCRYQRCLEVGMSKSAIKTGRYTHELRSKNIMEVKSLQKKNDLENSPVSESEFIDVVIDNEESQFDVCNDENEKLEMLLKVLLKGQSCLNEYLDEYYDEDLMKSRQFAVYYRYMGGKNDFRKNNFEPKHKQQQEESSHHTPLSSDIDLQKNVSESDIKCENSSPSSYSKFSYDSFDNSTHSLSGLTNGVEYNVNQNHSSNQSANNECHSQHVYRAQHSPMYTSGIRKSNGCRSEAITDRDTHIKHDQDTVNHFVQESCNVNKSNASIPLLNDEKKKGEVLSTVLKDVERSVQGLLMFSKRVPGFEDLQREDQAALLKASRFDIWYIGHIRCFNTDLRVGACEWQFHAEELEKVWGKKVVDLAFILSKRGQELDLSREETVALRAVCLTFSDRCYPLEERPRVEGIHKHMWDLLMYIGRKRHKNYNTWFTKVIDFLVILREFGINFESASSCLKLDWSVLNKNPFLLEVFLS